MMTILNIVHANSVDSHRKSGRPIRETITHWQAVVAFEVCTEVCSPLSKNLIFSSLPDPAETWRALMSRLAVVLVKLHDGSTTLGRPKPGLIACSPGPRVDIFVASPPRSMGGGAASREVGRRRRPDDLFAQLNNDYNT